jgi:hypothetical protein
LAFASVLFAVALAFPSADFVFPFSEALFEASLKRLSGVPSFFIFGAFSEASFFALVAFSFVSFFASFFFFFVFGFFVF